MKFRIWHKFTKQFVTEYLLYDSIGKKWHYAGTLYIDLNGKLSCYIWDDEQVYKIIPPEGYIIQQYVGLKDQNGVEIYEGDLIKGHQLPIGDLSAEVFWYSQESCWGVDGKLCGGKMTPSIKTYEVIGNIFESEHE